ncbi:hypothetical protein [Actinomycetospora lemnae]|uniref:Subtilisin inhibitor-like n=1 Tax=Actinomycetospora lemnae TaxID=3019891 RepID=A0ABT5SUP6_9PSEU|nr:hypothetical protein [Actinomycetospora sp. DW7H6]MDD7966566.1 hypothetical protein [Actinomycetospora sp. DW7H6]
MVRRLATCAIAAGVLLGVLSWGAATSVGVTTISHAAPLATSASLLPTWCPFGTHDGAGSGCRGGGINDNERVNRAARGTWVQYREAGRCAMEGVGGAASEGIRDPRRLGRLAHDSITGGFVCGVENYDEYRAAFEEARRGD